MSLLFNAWNPSFSTEWRSATLLVLGGLSPTVHRDPELPTVTAGVPLCIHQRAENLDEMDKFLDAYNKLNLNQEDINHQNSPITCNKMEAVIRNLPTKKSLGTDGLMAEFC
jgi:hypothetical protein